MLRFLIAVLMLPMAAGAARAQAADLSGRWISTPLVDVTGCVIYRRTATIDLRPGAGAGRYVGAASFTVVRTATGEPGCIDASRTEQDRVQVRVEPCSAGRVPVPGDVSWPSVKPCFDVAYRGSRTGVAYTSEIWHPHGGVLQVWVPQFAMTFALTRTPRR